MATTTNSSITGYVLRAVRSDLPSNLLSDLPRGYVVQEGDSLHFTPSETEATIWRWEIEAKTAALLLAGRYPILECLRVLPTTESIPPRVGLGATLCFPSDRYPYTIVAVSASGKQITIQADDYQNQDPWPDQNYLYYVNKNSATLVARLTKRGWKVKGTPVIIGFRRAYQAPEL